MARIYVASSWRNKHQKDVVSMLRNLGHDVYDFRNPPHGLGGFHWSDIDQDWQAWSPRVYRDHLVSSKICAFGFLSDLRAMQWADTFVLVMPCGRSAHLELGWATGEGKRTIIFLSDGEPELMYLLSDEICVDQDELTQAVGKVNGPN